MSGRKWVRRSLDYLAQTLQKRGYKIEQTTVRRLLKKLDYGLFSNRKSLSLPHPDRDKQFRFIRRVRKVFMATGRPVISVDAKKKELIGNFKNAESIAFGDDKRTVFVTGENKHSRLLRIDFSGVAAR